MDTRQHWNGIYERNSDDRVSWFESIPSVSLQMLDDAGLAPDRCVIDVGGGESRLVDALIARGMACLSVLDVSSAALERGRARLGPSGSRVRWLEADVTADWDSPPMDLWHDRAVFHFLTDAADRQRYVDNLLRILTPGGAAIIATFAPDGPEQCSGLPVRRYSSADLAAELGARFSLIESVPHTHRTPSGTLQSFQYSRLVRR